MDNLLAAEFLRQGGALRENQRSHNVGGEGIIHATGRRTQAVVKGWRWFALKVHMRSVQLAAGLEMHLLPNGYVGLCQAHSTLVNVCGLFRSRAPVPDLAQTWKSWLQGDRDSELRQRLSGAEFCPDSFCSVAGLLLRPQRAAEHPECCLGDAITVIAPLTGNGMSMAFESADLAVAPLISYSAGEMRWEAAVAEIAERCDRVFARRLQWSRWLQAAFLSPSAADAVIWLGSHAPAVWRGLFARTR
jgi:2-polyprenyl-6-methoxyphenol hydroxylase-like FAD-dependent oxidoreductase